MNLGLQGKLAVVSGSTAGIGLAIAAALAAEGAKVVVNGRTQPRVDAALKTIQQAVARADLRGVPETVAGTGLTVNSVLPGPTASEGVGGFLKNMAKQQNISITEIEKQFFASVRPSSLLKRFETPEEIASVVAFVASTQAVAINGAAVRAEGGVVRSIF